MYRVYYNKSSEYPFIWSIDAGSLDTEVKVKSVQFHKVVAETGIDPNIKVGDVVNPRVFFIVRYATLSVKDGHACLYHNNSWRHPSITS